MGRWNFSSRSHSKLLFCIAFVWHQMDRGYKKADIIPNIIDFFLFSTNFGIIQYLILTNTSRFPLVIFTHLESYLRISSPFVSSVLAFLICPPLFFLFLSFCSFSLWNNVPMECSFSKQTCFPIWTQKTIFLQFRKEIGDSMELALAGTSAPSIFWGKKYFCLKPFYYIQSNQKFMLFFSIPEQ